MTGNESRVINLFNLGPEEVKELLKNSMDGKHKGMDDETLCLFDLSQYRLLPYQALIIQKDGQMYKSESPTNQLLEEFSLVFNNFHESTRLAAAILKYKKKIPYVIGERAIMPLGGYTKNPTTWIVLNHIRRVDYDTTLGTAHLVNHHNLVLSIAMTRDMFENQLLRTASIFQCKLTLHIGRMKEYRHGYQTSTFSSPNILSERFERLNYEEPPCTYFEAEQMVRLYLEKKRSKEIQGAGNPYYDDYLNSIRRQLL
jgi:hypothetical protein